MPLFRLLSPELPFILTLFFLEFEGLLSLSASKDVYPLAQFVHELEPDLEYVPALHFIH